MTKRPPHRAYPHRSILAASLALAAVAPAFAQTRTASQATDLDAVVVTAAGFEQKLTDAPASITLVTRDELARRPYANLIDALRDIEGIDVGMESTDKNGEATISMRGLGSEYTLVLIDGRRQSNVGDLYPNNFGGGQFSFVPPLEAIERIEVVRGPMSTLYGSDAMGGVVNIITRKVGDRWHGAVTQAFTFQQDDDFGDDRKTDLYVGGPLVADRLGLAVRGSWYDRDESMPEWDPLPLPDGTMWERTLGFGGGGKRVGATNWNAGVRLSFTPNDDHDLILDYDIARLKYDNSQGQTGTLDSIESLWRSGNATVPAPGGNGTVRRRVVQPRVGYTAYQRYERDQLALTHIGRWDFGTSTTSLMHHKTSNLGRSLPLTVDERDQLQTLWNDVCARRGLPAYCDNGTGLAGIESSGLTADELARLQAFLPRQLRTLELEGVILDSMLEMQFGEHLVTVGGQYNDTDMEDGVFGMDGAGFRPGTKQTHKQWAVFAEDNWGFTDTLTATLGVRYDHHNIFGSHVSPRAYLVWDASDAWTLKGGVSTGYKAPKPNYLFPGITGFGGQGVSPMVGTPDLQPETSTNFEIAAYYEDDAWGFNATAFYNRFKDKIATGDNFPNCEVAPAGGGYCVDIGPGWAALGYTTFSQRINIDRAETRGVELAAHADLAAGFSLRGNYTWTQSEQKSGAQEGRPITGNPAEHIANATLQWAATPSIDLSLIAEARYDRYRDYDAATDRELYYGDYTVFHLGASWRINDAFGLNARVNNLFDKDFISQTCTLADTQDSYLCVDEYLIKDQRRSFWISANYRF
ncbi:TonB-dependent receptor domain-containing protein [Luteimonas huabeiensis]|uniref:TonB-dependent receptor domain-containing protein n=1 Tax=Luteimonas huabeiensis TaxID=1244513 RepID=UPI0004632A40|nr:TonB-dependent receptor [Luteimonas huabeiensis]